MNEVYNQILIPFHRQLQIDLDAGKIGIDDFRRIGRAIETIANYLDYGLGSNPEESGENQRS